MPLIPQTRAVPGCRSVADLPTSTSRASSAGRLPSSPAAAAAMPACSSELGVTAHAPAVTTPSRPLSGAGNRSRSSSCRKVVVVVIIVIIVIVLAGAAVVVVEVEVRLAPMRRSCRRLHDRCRGQVTVVVIAGAVGVGTL